MGGIFSFGRKSVKVLVSGLDCAGKTTIIYQINTVDVTKTIPTLGMHQKTQYKNLDITSWDSGGYINATGDTIKRNFLKDVAGVVYVVDASDHERINESLEELRRELSYIQQDPNNVPLLIFANKIDLPNAMSADAIIEAFELDSMQNRTWHVQLCNGTTGQGLIDGFEWLKKQIDSKSN